MIDILYLWGEDMKKLSAGLIIVGLIIFLIPILGRLTTTYIDKRLIYDWEHGKTESTSSIYNNVYSIYDKLLDNFSAENKSEKDLIDNLPSTSKGISNKNLKHKLALQEVIGIINIAKIKISLPIVEGVKKENLRVGIGHVPDTSNPGDVGNCALAGHRSYTFGSFFNRLDELNIGDVILITAKKGIYRYRIYKKFVVLPEDVSVLDTTMKESIITLITCTPIRVATHRLIIKASLMN